MSISVCIDIYIYIYIYFYLYIICSTAWADLENREAAGPGAAKIQSVFLKNETARKTV